MRRRTPAAALLVLVIAGAVGLAFPGCGSRQAKVTLPKGTPFPEALQTRLHDIRDRAAKLRDLPIEDSVQESELTRDQLAAFYEEQASKLTADDRREIDAYNAAFRLLHMIGPDDDLYKASTDFDTAGILGFYEFDSNALVLVGDRTELSQDDELTLAHEYIHSFQHKQFDINRINDLAEKESEQSDDKVPAATEYSTTTDCVTEGDASLAQVLYAQQQFGPDYFDRNDGASADSTYDGIPPALQRYELFNYNECVAFAAALWRDGGWDAVDEVYAKPPWTTEQILHPEKYLAGEGSTGMSFVDLTERLGGGWRRLAAGAFGEFDLYNYLATALEDEAAAKQVAAGWGSGWLGVYTTSADQGGDAPAAGGSETLVHLAIEFDTDADRAEFLIAYGAYIDKFAGGREAFGDRARPTCWAADREFGYLMYSEQLPRVDIVITDSQSALEGAIAKRLSTDAAACPAIPPA